MDRQFFQSLFETVTEPPGPNLGKKCPTGFKDLFFFQNHRVYLEFEGRLVRPKLGAFNSLLLHCQGSPSKPEDLETIDKLEREIEGLRSWERRTELLTKFNLRNFSPYAKTLLESHILGNLGVKGWNSPETYRTLLQENGSLAGSEAES